MEKDQKRWNNNLIRSPIDFSHVEKENPSGMLEVIGGVNIADHQTTFGRKWRNRP